MTIVAHALSPIGKLALQIVNAAAMGDGSCEVSDHLPRLADMLGREPKAVERAEFLDIFDTAAREIDWSC